MDKSLNAINFHDDTCKVQYKNPKLTREQWILFFKQQTIQVAMLMEALDQAYEKIRSLEAQKNKREEEDADEDI